MNPKKTSREDSCLTERWYLEYEVNKTDKRRKYNSDNSEQLVPKLRICEVACIADRVYVVEETPGVHPTKNQNSSLVILVKKREMWVPYFTDLKLPICQIFKLLIDE